MGNTPELPASAPLVAPERFPPAAASRMAAKLLNRHSAHEIAEAIEVLVDVLDLIGGDPEAEDNGDAEPAGDEKDIAWQENHNRGRFMGNQANLGSNEDDEQDDDREDDDPREEDDPSGQCDEDGMNYGLGRMTDLGPGCPLADTAEREQMADDVPMLPVVSLEYNVFNDQRQKLGMSNLLSSFIGKDVRSADTGAIHNGKPPSGQPEPGSPV